jgi:PAS domain S-box-containing protein
MVVDEFGTILFANSQVSLLFGYVLGELEGQSVELLLPERLRLTHIGHRLRFTDERRTRPMGNGQGLVARCKDGCERRVQVSLRPVQHGLETLVVAVFVEVDEPSQAEVRSDVESKEIA